MLSKEKPARRDSLFGNPVAICRGGPDLTGNLMPEVLAERTAGLKELFGKSQIYVYVLFYVHVYLCVYV